MEAGALDFARLSFFGASINKTTVFVNRPAFSETVGLCDRLG